MVADQRGGDRSAEGRPGADLVGYHVEATDGGIGSVDGATYDAGGAAHLVVDPGPWIFGRKVLLPAGMVRRVDHDARKTDRHGGREPPS